ALLCLGTLLIARILFPKPHEMELIPVKSLTTAGFPRTYSPFVFLGGARLALIGMMLWCFGMGAQDSLLKAVLTSVVSAAKRSTAFGVFDTGFGIAWFLGSALLG